MSTFLQSEKVRQAEFKASSHYFSAAARGEGIYRGKVRPFCLPRGCAEENLFPGIRQSALEYFRSKDIQWHDGQASKPSNHLCDSQVCCLNFLFPLADQPGALAEVLRPLFPAIGRMLPVEDGLFVGCEWIGRENYLCEKIARSGKRTRGANCTSADAVVMFERTDGKRQIVLIEWKYTESYDGTPLSTAKSGTDRTEIYRALFERGDCPINRNLLSSFNSLFYEPFYQMMRQQLLAHEMELGRELEADTVSVLHISPACNADFRTVTSPELTSLGDSAVSVWERLVGPCGRFISVSTEKLFGALPDTKAAGARPELDYIVKRYAWVQTGPTTLA
jgi:hypothetical protein